MEQENILFAFLLRCFMLLTLPYIDPHVNGGGVGAQTQKCLFTASPKSIWDTETQRILCHPSQVGLRGGLR